MDLTEQDVIKRVLAEHRLDAERVLAGLLGTLVDWHLGSRMRPGGDGGRGPNATMLEELCARIGLEAQRNEQIFQRQAGDGAESDPTVGDEAFMDGIIRGAQASVQRALAHMLAECQALGERHAEQEREEARLLGEAEPGSKEDTPPETPPPPHMRLVKD